MMKKWIFLIPGLIISLNIFSQNDSLIRQLELKLLKYQYDSVIDQANTIIEKDTGIWQVYYYLGRSYQSKYKYFDAIREYEVANKLDSANKVIENALAETYSFIGKEEDAIQIYYDQYLRDTTQLQPIVMLANLFRKNREFAPAIHYYQKVVFIDPQNFYYYKQLAYCFDKINIPVGAIHMYNSAIKLNPYDVSLYIQLANIYNTERVFPEAINTCNLGLENHKDSHQLLKIRAYSYYLNKEFDSSIVGFCKLLEFRDSSFFNYKYLGLAYFEKQDFTSAIKYLNNADEINKNDPEVSFFLGSSLGRTEQYKEGLYELNRTLRILDPPANDLANIYSEMAHIYQNLAEYEKSLEYLKLAYKKDASPLLSFKMAQLYDYYLDNKRLAVNYYDGYLTMTNAPDTLPSGSGIIQNSFTRDSAMVQNANERIRILKEELFFEEGKKE